MRHHELTPVLDVSGLHVWFPRDPRSGAGDGPLRAVENVSFALYSGRTLGLIGESGCGKTLTAQAVLQLVPAPGRMRALHIALHGDGDRDAPVDVASLDPHGTAIRRVRGGQIAMVSRTPTGVSHQFEPLERSCARLSGCTVPSVDAKPIVYPLSSLSALASRSHGSGFAYQLSEGMSQRVAIALALCGEPRVLIADEPTTALDPELQRQVVHLIGHLQSVFDMAVLYITHDLGLVEDACDEVAVMYLGCIVEQAPVQTLLTRPLHPYTRRLLESVPVLGRRRGRLPMVPGAVPRLLDIPPGCSFAPRCEDVTPTCRGDVPALVEVAPGHRVRCYLHNSQREPSAED